MTGHDMLVAVSTLDNLDPVRVLVDPRCRTPEVVAVRKKKASRPIKLTRRVENGRPVFRLGEGSPSGPTHLAVPLTTEFVYSPSDVQHRVSTSPDRIELRLPPGCDLHMQGVANVVSIQGVSANVILRTMNTVHLEGGNAANTRLDAADMLQLHGVARQQAILLENIVNVHLWNDQQGQAQNVTMDNVPFVDYCNRGSGTLAIGATTIDYLRLEAALMVSEVTADHIGAAHVISEQPGSNSGKVHLVVETLGNLFGIDTFTSASANSSGKTEIVMEARSASAATAITGTVERLRNVGLGNSQLFRVLGGAVSADLFSTMAEAYGKRLPNDSVDSGSLTPASKVPCAVISRGTLDRTFVAAAELGLGDQHQRRSNPHDFYL